MKRSQTNDIQLHCLTDVFNNFFKLQFLIIVCFVNEKSERYIGVNPRQTLYFYFMCNIYTYIYNNTK